MKTYKDAAKYSKHCERIYNSLNNDISKTFYNYKEDNIKEDNNADTEGASTNTTNFTTKEYDELQTAYVKIPGFTDVETNVPALNEYFNKISDFKFCIIDLRGNGGGNDNYWMDGIVSQNLKENTSFSYYFLIKGDNSKDYIKGEIELNPIKKLDLSSITNINLDDVADMSYYSETKQEYKKAEHPIFQGSFYVLTDNDNYSSAESFVTFCKRSGFATLIGESTGGDGMGIDPMITVLPNSGICFRFSILYGLNEDGASNEEKGTQPDIDCTGKDSLDICLDLIRGK